MDRKETKAMLKKANELKDKIGDMLTESEVEIRLALTVLTTLTVDCALRHAEIPPHELIRMLAHAVCKAHEVIEEELEEESEEEDEQIIGRTTH